MTEGIGLSSPLNDIEARLSRLEARAPAVELPSIQVTLDDDGSPVQANPLDFTVGAFAPYPTLTAAAVAGDPSGTWSDGAEGLLTPTASRVGNMIFLSGTIRRTGGSTTVANTNLNLSMFRLPLGWRPTRTVLFLCPCSGSSSAAPEATVATGVALIAIKPDSAQSAGLVKLVTANTGLTASPTTGAWIALGGAFPGAFTADSPSEPPEGSWDASPPGQTWDQIDDLVTWNSWPNRSG
jgi:hypothetical protein